MYDATELKDWSFFHVMELNNAGKLDFKAKYQRGLVWSVPKKNLLIDSLLRKIPVPLITVVKKDVDGVKHYEILDGKQRLTTVLDFMNDDFKLKGLQELEYEDGGKKEIIDLNGMKYSELPKTLQKKIENTVLRGDYYEELTKEEKIELFNRINNGKSLSGIELSWSKAESIDEIMDLAEHDLFKEHFTVKNLEKGIDKEIVIKIYTVLFKTKPSLEQNFIKPIIASAKFTEEEIKTMNDVFSYISDACNMMKGKKIIRKVLTKTHLISISPTIRQAIKDGRTVEEVKEFLEDFFNAGKETTKSKAYNKSAAGSGTAKSAEVKTRISEVMRAYKKFFKSKTKEEGLDEEMKNTEIETETEVESEIENGNETEVSSEQ